MTSSDLLPKLTSSDLLNAYIRNAAAHVLHEPLDGNEPDERLMRSVEQCMDIPEQCADDYRRAILCRWAAQEVLDGRRWTPGDAEQFGHRLLEAVTKMASTFP